MKKLLAIVVLGLLLSGNAYAGWFDKLPVLACKIGDQHITYDLRKYVDISKKKYNESFFKKIDEIENIILDGGKIINLVKEFNLSLVTINKTNRLKKNIADKDIAKIDDLLFEKIFSPKIVNKPELININNKYYLSEVLSIDKIARTLEDKKIKDAIVSQLKTKYIIENNTRIINDMSQGTFNEIKFKKFSKEKNIEIKKITLKDVKDEAVFNSRMIKEIFKVNDGDFQLITDSLLTKNYIVLAEKTEKLTFNKNITNYEKYKTKAKFNLANQIYSTFDKTINNKYDVEINQKVLSRIKNTL